MPATKSFVECECFIERPLLLTIVDRRRSLIRLKRADQMPLVAVTAFGDVVIHREGVPMRFLFGRQNARTATKWARVFKSGQNRRPDERRAVSHPSKRLHQRRFSFERDNSRFVLRHQFRPLFPPQISPIRLRYYFVIPKGTFSKWRIIRDRWASAGCHCEFRAIGYIALP